MTKFEGKSHQFRIFQRNIQSRLPWVPEAFLARFPVSNLSYKKINLWYPGKSRQEPNQVEGTRLNILLLDTLLLHGHFAALLQFGENRAC